ncbi:ATP synthase F1 subunit gamma [soil metagenome]
MAKTREIKKRIKAVGNIRRITKTMQMIATSKFARAQAAATATKPYTEGLFNLVTELAATAGEIDHPLMGSAKTSLVQQPGQPLAGGKELILVITSDRGLAGPYNGSILRTFMQQRRERGSGANATTNANTLIELVGKKGAGFLRYNNIGVSRQHTFGDKPTFATIAELAQDYMRRFIDGEISAVKVVSMRFISAGRQTPEIKQLLPLKAIAKPAASAPSATAANPAAPKTTVQYDFSPDAQELLGDLLPETVKATLFQIFNDAIVSEHVARMVAMKAATDNAGKMRKNLTRDYNRARQAAITTELSEIIAGAASL